MSKFLSSEWRKKLLDAGFPPAELSRGEAEEILRRLPNEIYATAPTEMDERRMKGQEMPKLKFVVKKIGADWQIEYWSPYLDAFEHTEGDTLANAAAAMYCYLAENDLLPKAA